MKQKLLTIIILLLTLQGFIYAQDAMEQSGQLSMQAILDSVNEIKKPDIKDNAAEQNYEFIKSITIETEYDVPDSTGSGYLAGWDDLTPIIMTFVDSKGIISICSTDQDLQETYIYEYSCDLLFLRTLKFKNVYEKIGAFTKDDDGNYYLFFARQAKNKDSKNMALIKYNNEGEKIKELILGAFPRNSFSGVSLPFYVGSCRIELSGSMLAVYFARKMFNGHQASYGFVLDKETFERIDTGAMTNSERLGYTSEMPYASHSLNQFILPVDNGFIFVDQGDSYPRSFDFSWFNKGVRTKRLGSFKFKKSSVYQYTFAQIGGLTKTEDGYIFAGTYEKNKIVKHSSHNDSRNFFIVTFDNELTKCSDAIWLTNYSDKANDNAANPKITGIGLDRFLILWERRIASFLGYKTTYVKIIDKNGEALSNEVEIKGIYLNKNDVLRYNQVNNTVIWAVNYGARKINLYSLNPDMLE